MTVRLESEHLLIASRRRVTELLGSQELSEEAMIDLYINLHLALEIGINTLMRHLVLDHLKKTVDKIKVIENVDRIGFIEKTVLFIYNSSFSFPDIVEANRVHNTVIGKLRSFAEVRNLMLHGHSISTLYEESGERSTRASKFMNDDKVRAHLAEFRAIMGGLRFFIDCLQSNWNAAGKDSLKVSYLDDSFIPSEWR